MGILDPSKLNIKVEQIPTESEVIKIFNERQKLVALFICSPMAVKKGRYTFTSVLLDVSYEDSVCQILNSFLAAEKSGDYRKFLNFKTRSSDVSYFSINTLRLKLSYFGVWVLIILSSLGINLGLMKYLGY